MTTDPILIDALRLEEIFASKNRYLPGREVAALSVFPRLRHATDGDPIGITITFSCDRDGVLRRQANGMRLLVAGEVQPVPCGYASLPEAWSTTAAVAFAHLYDSPAASAIGGRDGARLLGRDEIGDDPEGLECRLHCLQRPPDPRGGWPALGRHRPCPRAGELPGHPGPGPLGA